jgi:hypothetical protein
MVRGGLPWNFDRPLANDGYLGPVRWNVKLAADVGSRFSYFNNHQA